MKGVLFQLKRYTASEWSDSNPVLLSGEPGIELQEDASIKLKFGNGVDNWNDLPYFANSKTIPPAESGSFKGTCDTHTDPGTPTVNEWWSATEVGIYPYFGNVEVLTLDEVFNYIKWDGLAETWSIEIVPVNMAYVQIPKVADGVWDLNVTKNLELEVNPYRGKVLDNAFGRPYFYLGTETPTLHVRLNLEGDLAVSKLFAWALNLPNIATGKWLTVDENNNIVGSDAPSGGLTPTDGILFFDTATVRYIAYPDKFSMNPGYAYFYEGTSIPTFPNRVNLDGELYVKALKNAVSGSGYSRQIALNNAQLLSFFQTITNTYEYRFYLETTGLLIEALSSDESNTKSAPIKIGALNSLDLKHGEHIIIDDFNQRFDINMTKVRLNKLTASKMLVTDANKEIACVDMPDFTLAKFYTDASNVGSSATDAFSYTLPANTLNANGKQIDIVTYGNNLVNANSKGVTFKWGSTNLQAISLHPTHSYWKLYTSIIRISSTEIKVLSQYWIGIDGSGGMGSAFDVIGSINFAIANTMKLTLQGGSTGDVIARLETIKLYP
jgi:hypothetical protein